MTEPEPVQEPHNMKKVRDLHGQLQDTVSNLSTKITVLLREREKDFLAAYRHHMYNVQKDLQEAKRSVKKAKDDLRNNDQIKKLKKERDWFRNEALRLEKMSKTQEKEIGSIQTKFNTLREDRVWFEKQLKIAKRQNKILTAELGMQLHRGAENMQQQQQQNRPQTTGSADDATEGNRSPSPEGFSGPLSVEGRATGGRLSMNSTDGLTQINDTVSDLRHTIEELKDKLRDAKRKNRNLQAVVNHHNKSGEYEALFMECVDEVKGEAARRREKLLMSQRRSRRDAGIVELHDIKTIAKQELSQLTTSDKKKIIEALLHREEIFPHLHALIFDQPDSPERERLPRIES